MPNRTTRHGNARQRASARRLGTGRNTGSTRSNKHNKNKSPKPLIVHMGNNPYCISAMASFFNGLKAEGKKAPIMFGDLYMTGKKDIKKN